MSSGTLADGTVFASRYRIIRCIAGGGMGAVYEVVHLETERRRALKVLHPQFLENAELRSRFRKEARVAANVESRHIVDVFDAGIDEATGMPFLVMELLRGEELGKRLVRVHRFTPAEVLSYLHQTALALDQTHRAQIVHRDLKPDNLFLCEQVDGPPLITVLDFGIAKLIAEGSAQAQATRSLGTPMYMAPEQFRSAAAVSPATDIFALGMIAYTLLVGACYWLEESRASGNVYEFVGAAAGGPREPPSARALRQGVTLPPAFDAWFARTTAPSPADRFPSASAAVQALAYALGLPQPGQAPYAAVSAGPGPAWMDSSPALTGSGGLPAGSAVVSSRAETPITGSGTPPAGPGVISRGSGTAIIAGPVVPVRPAPANTLGKPTVIPAARHRRSAVVAAVAISAAMLLVGGAVLYYTVHTVLSPRSEAGAPTEPAAVPAVTAAPEPPELKTTPPTVVASAVETPPPASTAAMAEPQGSTASSSIPPVPALAAASAVSPSSHATTPRAGHPAGTAAPAPSKAKKSIHSKD